MKFQIQKKHIPYLILLFFGLLMFTMGLLNHYLFRTATHDYGNYNFAFWDYSHFRLSQIPTFKGNFLQDHFSFSLMYFVPAYWLLNWLTHTYTLIIIQVSLIILSAWYTLKIVQLKSDNIWLGAGVILYYFLLLGRYTAFSADVNLAIISSCFIPIFIYYFFIKKYLLAFAILLLSLFSRENIPLWFIFIFIVLIIDERKDKKAIWYAVSGIIISALYFILLFKVFIPMTESKEVSYGLFNYAALGKTPGEALVYMLRHPVEAVKLFFINHSNNPTYNDVKAEFYLVYLVSGGFVLLFRPKYIIWFIPIVAQKVLNDNPTRWGIATYYSIEIVTLLPLSVFLAIASFKKSWIQKTAIVLACIGAIFMTIHKLDHSNRKVPWTLNPSKVKVYSKKFYTSHYNVKAVNRLLATIPDTAKVSASNYILPHLAQRKSIYYFPNVKDAEYIVFSVYDNHYLLTHMQNENERNKYLGSNEWEITQHSFPVFLLKHNSKGTLNTNSIWTEADTIKCNYETISEKDKTILFSNGEKAEKTDLLSTEQARSLTHSIKLSTEARYGSKITLPDITQYDYLEINVWGLCEELNQIHLVSDCGKNYHFHCSVNNSIDSSGWKKFTLSYWVPKNAVTTECSMFIWNSGKTPVYIDDLEIIKKKLKLN
ncbi:DUF2079 domain-containing protein [uncultured Draconibacterium sp.]|uniref:DUF2079 domain-containing protein n=2 Tax=uncultured Draconibacterium sp. TaxID=1573823 RepID=UPI003216D90A